QAHTSLYTPSSRNRRAISRVVCEPKSTTRMPCSRSLMDTRPPWRRRSDGLFVGDDDVVDVALPEPCWRDADELRASAKRVDIGAAGVAHPCTQPADESMDDGADGSTVGDTPLDTFGDQLLGFGGGLEIAVTAAFDHGAHRSHPTIHLVAPPLLRDTAPRRFVGAREEAADHDGGCARGDGFDDVAAALDAAVRDDRGTMRVGRCAALTNGVEWWHADARDGTGGLDAARTDADLALCPTGFDERAGGLGRRDVASDEV